MSDVFEQPKLLPGMAEFAGVIRFLWDRDNVFFSEKYNSFSNVSARLREALMHLGIRNPRIEISCFIAYPKKLKGKERTSYENDPLIEIIHAANSEAEKVFQGVDEKIKDVLREKLEDKNLGLGSSCSDIIVVMTGDIDFKKLMEQLEEVGVVVLSIQPRTKLLAPKEPCLLNKSMRRSGTFNASLDDIEVEGTVVKWLPQEVEDVPKLDELERLKRKYENEKAGGEKDWGEYLLNRFGQDWLVDVKNKHGDRKQELGPYLASKMDTLL